MTWLAVRALAGKAFGAAGGALRWLLTTRAGLATLAALLLAFGVWRYGESRYAAGVAAEKHANAAAWARQAELNAAAAAKAEQARRTVQAFIGYVQDRYLEAAQQHQKDKADAYDRGMRAALAVRRGDLELHDYWAGCPKGAAPGARDVPASAAASGAGGTDEGAAELRAASAGRIVQVGADADADLAFCLRTLSAAYGRKP